MYNADFHENFYNLKQYVHPQTSDTDSSDSSSETDSSFASAELSKKMQSLIPRTVTLGAEMYCKAYIQLSGSQKRIATRHKLLQNIYAIFDTSNDRHS